MRSGHLPDWSSPDDPARVLAAVGRLNPSGYDDDDDDGGNDDDNHVDDDDEEEEADSDDEMIKRRIAGVQSNRQLQRIKWQILSLPPSLSLHLSLCTPRPCKSIAMG